MKYSIFHTSHCGSTYLSALLSKSIPSLAEPLWTHESYKQDDFIEFIKSNQKDGEVVKFPSVCCSAMPFIDGKKVFLYNNLHNHIHKKKDCSSVAFHLTVMEPRYHKKTKSIEHNYSSIPLQSTLWADRIFWAIDSDDIMFIESSELFKNPEYIIKQICQFFGIKYVPVEVNFHVKSIQNNILRSNKHINLDEAIDKEEYIMPYIPLNFEALKMCEKMAAIYPKLKYFVI